MANILKREKQEAIIRCLTDGNSIRSTERIVDVHRDTIMRFMVRVGEGCARLMDSEMHGLTSKRIECDELWCYVGKKQRHLTVHDDPNRVGDTWIWIALDADTKIIPVYRVGKRDRETAMDFMEDLARRVSNRVEISTDALSHYIEAVQFGFGANADYGSIVKSYEAEAIGPGRYSPPKVTSVKRKALLGNPQKISTSYVERANLTHRMQMRRLTRLTNGFSKKIENLKAATALHLAHYNFVRNHRTLGTTPAVAAGIMFQPWTVSDLLDQAI